MKANIPITPILATDEAYKNIIFFGLSPSDIRRLCVYEQVEVLNLSRRPHGKFINPIPGFTWTAVRIRDWLSFGYNGSAFTVTAPGETTEPTVLVGRSTRIDGHWFDINAEVN